MSQEFFKAKIILVDDDQDLRSVLAEYLKAHAYSVHEYDRASIALKDIQEKINVEDFDLIISDINMPEMTGLEFTERMKLYNPDIPIILITAFGSIETAIEATRKGVYDYIVKPFKFQEMQVSIDRAVHYRRLRKENQILRSEIKKDHKMGQLIGKSKAMREVFDLVKKVSTAQANVLITGESGTGKEMIAKAIHNSGPRANKSFVAINCTAIPESLLESELFGHEKGSFTGAIAKKKGLFEEADGGTIFLDEIGDMDLALQAKLLRVLQERSIKTVGGNTYKDIDVRIIAATHKDLKAEIRDGRFREDLYYRLSVIPISIPPLRYRKDDIPILASYFLEKYSTANNSKTKAFAPSALRVLSDAMWEGNVRELENLVERLVVLSNKEIIEEADLPSVNQSEDSYEDFYGKNIQTYPSLETLEKRYIQYILQKTGGRKEKTSQILGINRRTLYRKEREYGFVAADPEMESEMQNQDLNTKMLSVLPKGEA